MGMTPVTHPDDCTCYPCRGRKARQTLLLHESQAHVAEIGRVYSNAEKQRVRETLLRAVGRLGGPVLDLWGSGESSRQIARAFPGIALTAAETDRLSHRALVHDAKEHGYVAFPGDVTRVEGLYNVINLDTCNGISKAADLARKMVEHLDTGGLMLVTVMGTDRHDTYTARAAGFAAELSVVCKLSVVCVFRYRMLSGVPAFVIGLTQEHALRDLCPDPAVIHAHVARWGCYTKVGWAFLSDYIGSRTCSKDYQRRQRGDGRGVDRPCQRPTCPGRILAGRRTNARYCSATCERLMVGRRTKKRATARRLSGLICPQCQKSVVNARQSKFCSRVCMLASIRERRLQPPAALECGVCGARIPVGGRSDRLYCSPICSRKASMGMYKEHHPEYRRRNRADRVCARPGCGGAISASDNPIKRFCSSDCQIAHRNRLRSGYYDRQAAAA